MLVLVCCVNCLELGDFEPTLNLSCDAFCFCSGESKKSHGLVVVSRSLFDEKGPLLFWFTFTGTCSGEQLYMVDATSSSA